MQAFRILCCVVLALLCTRHVHAQPNLTPPELLAGEPPAAPAAMQLAAEARVEVELTVDEQGATRDVALVTSSGHAELDALALDAARALRFAPATRDAAPIAARIPFRFTFAPAPPPPAPSPAPPPTPAPVTPPPAPIVLDVLGERPPREATAHVISAEQARTLPGSNGDPLRAVENMPGVGRPPGLNGDLIVRGSAPQDSVIFIDGIAVPSAYHFGGLSSVIPTEALDRIDFRPGNFGPEYGRAMGGVVELGMRSPRADRYSGLVQVDSIDGRFLLQGPLGKRTRFLIAGRRSWLDAWLPHVLNDDEVALKSAPVYYDGQLVLEHDLTRRTVARLFLFGSDDRMALLFKSPDGQDPSQGGRLSARNSFLRLGLRLNTRFNDAVSLTNMLSWGPERSSFVFGIDSFDFTVQQFAWRSELRARLHRSITATAGIDLAASQYDLRLYVRPYPATDEVDGPEFARPSRLFEDKIWLFRPAAYALLELTPLEGLRLVPSVRLDYTHDTGKVTADPRLAMRAVLHDGPYRTTFKAGVGLFHQPPQGVESVSPYGTPGVRSNRSIHTSAGFEQEFMPGLSLSLEGFYKHYSDLVVSIPDEDGSPVGARFENRGSGRAYGSELLLRYQGDSRFHGWLSYTLSRSERRNQPDEPLHLFEWDQTHILSALGSVDVGAGFTLGARFRFVSGTPYTPYVGGIVDLDAGAYAAVPASQSYSARLPSFQQLDLRVDKTFKIRSGRLVAYLELRNAYNRKNTEQISYRFDYAQAKRESGLPILPVIGLRGEL